MIDVMNAGKEAEKGLDPQLWHACAGGMVQIPPLNSTLIYFPQGHIEHSQVSVDFTSFPSLPPLLPCRLSSITYLADPDSDEVFAKLTLLPLQQQQQQLLFPDDESFFSPPPPPPPDGANSDLDKPASFAKTLTQSDANNGGGFSVPRYCAETIFPRLDYSAEPPVQTILARDVHGVTWKFRHIYRGTPRRHLLTTGWSNFVNHKKLLAGDSIVFLRAENGDLCVGIRRAKKGIGGGTESPPSSGGGGWNAPPPPPPPPPCVGYAAFLRDDQRGGFGRVNSGLALGPGGKVGVDSVVESARLAASGRPFEVVYYPRASTPEFCVKASAVRAAMQVQWCCGMRFKMAFETEDSSRISWFMGTISGVQVADHLHWPNSPWRLLRVAWDEPELLQNVKRVNPWLVELVATMPPIHMSRKKLRLSQQPDFPFIDQLHMPPQKLSSNPLKPSSPFNITAGIQGARHAHFGQPPFPTTLGRLHSGLFPAFLKHPQNAFPSHSFITSKPDRVTEDVSCFLTIGRHYDDTSKKSDDSSVSAPKFMLFGKPILTEEQISQSSSGDSSSNSTPGKSVQKATSDSAEDQRVKTDLGLLQAGHCKLFMESEDVDRTTLDKKLANMFGIERPEMLNNANHKPFSEFLKTARTLTILADAGSENLAR